MEYIKLEMESGEIIGLELPTDRIITGKEQKVAARRNNESSLFYRAEPFLDTIASFAQNIGRKLRECKASEIEIEFGVGFDVNTGEILSVIVNGSTKSSLNVKLKWKEDKKPNEERAET